MTRAFLVKAGRRSPQPLTFPRPNSVRIGRFRKPWLGERLEKLCCFKPRLKAIAASRAKSKGFPPPPSARLCSPLGRLRGWPREAMIAHVTRASHPAPLSQHFPHCLKIRERNKMEPSLEVVQPIQPSRWWAL